MPKAAASRGPGMIFRKTTMCKFHSRQMCSKGDECNFAHSREELHPLPDLRNTRICPALLKSGSCKDVTCRFAHRKTELRQVGKARAVQGTNACEDSCTYPEGKGQRKVSSRSHAASSGPLLATSSPSGGDVAVSPSQGSSAGEVQGPTAHEEAGQARLARRASGQRAAPRARDRVEVVELSPASPTVESDPPRQTTRPANGSLSPKGQSPAPPEVGPLVRHLMPHLRSMGFASHQELCQWSRQHSSSTQVPDSSEDPMHSFSGEFSGAINFSRETTCNSEASTLVLIGEDGHVNEAGLHVQNTFLSVRPLRDLTKPRRHSLPVRRTSSDP